ncbi:MAG: hypothetical protein R2800_08945 [Flavipsychrobacter sp.]
MKYFLLVLLATTAMVEPAAAIDLMGEAVNNRPSQKLSLVLPAPRAKLIPDQVVRTKKVNTPKMVAYTLGFAGGVSLGYGLTSLLVGNTADNIHNKAIITGGALLGISMPIAMIGGKRKEQQPAAPQKEDFYHKPVIKPQLCIAANKNGLGLALNF